MFIDTHTHLNFPEFKDDWQVVIERAKANGIEAIINIALDETAIPFSSNLTKLYPGYVFGAAGIHPHEAANWNSNNEKQLKDLALRKEIVAIGEMGLDYFP